MDQRKGKKYCQRISELRFEKQITLDDIGQNEFVQSSKGKVPEKLHGVEFRDSFTRYIEKSMREAYKNVKAKYQEA